MVFPSDTNNIVIAIVASELLSLSSRLELVKLNQCHYYQVAVVSLLPSASELLLFLFVVFGIYVQQVVVVKCPLKWKTIEVQMDGRGKRLESEMVISDSSREYSCGQD